MASKTEIFNLALVVLGDATVQDPQEDSTAAIALNSFYAATVDAVLRAHPWNCAETLAQIAADASAPAFGFDYRYRLPTDPYCLRVRQIADGHPSRKFKVRGRYIHTNQSAPLNLVYTARLTDAADFDALLAQAVAARLAHRVAYRLTQSRTKEADAWEIYKEILAEARSIDGQEGSPDDIAGDEFLESRY